MKYQYNGQQTDLPKSVTHYVKAVERHLSLPKKIRRRVLSDLLTGMCARNENGESYPEILASMEHPHRWLRVSTKKWQILPTENLPGGFFSSVCPLSAASFCCIIS